MRFVPLRVLVLGGTVAAGKAFWFDAEAVDFAAFLAGFEVYVKTAIRCDIIVLKEFSTGHDDGPMRAMTDAGFIAHMCYDRSSLALPADGGMQGFLDSLPSKKRRNLRQVMARGEAAGLEVEVHRRFDHLVDTAYALYLGVNARASEARTPTRCRTGPSRRWDRSMPRGCSRSRKEAGRSHSACRCSGAPSSSAW